MHVGVSVGVCECVTIVGDGVGTSFLFLGGCGFVS